MRLTTVELVEHPLDGRGATSYALDLPPAAVVADIVPAGARVAVMVDDDDVAPEHWPTMPIAGRTVRVTAAAEGDLFRPLLQIAVAAAAAYVGGPWGAAIAIGGGLAIQLFVPLPQPDFGGASDGATLYSLSGASSRARLYESLPLVIGTHRVVADIGARHRSYFSGDDQWLEGVWHFGLGGSGLVIDEDTLAFGDIPFAVLDDLDYEIAERPSNVAGSVDTVTGGRLTTTAIIRQAPPGTTRVEIDITGQLFGLSKKGSSQNRSVPMEVVIGAASYGVTAINHQQEPYRLTLSWDLAAAGAPQVSVRRTQEPSTSNRTYDTLDLAAVKFIKPDPATYPGQVRLGVRVRASGQLQGQLPPLHAIASQHAAVYADGAWSDTLEATSNPAAQLRQYALGYRAGGALLAGMGLAAAEIDDAELGRWYDYCNTHGLQCNAVLQGGATHDSVLRMLAECGDAHVSWAPGRLSVVWEDVARVPSVMIGPQHIVAGSMSLEYAFDLVDEVVVRFVDPDLDWALNPIRRRRTGVTSVQRSTTTTARGVTSAAQAARAANRLIASAEHRARRFAWRMGADGARLSPGAVAWVSHDLISGGQTGRLVSILSGTVLTLDAHGAVAGDHLLIARATGDVVQRAIASVSGREVTLAVALPDAAVADEPRDVAWRLYSDAADLARAVILGVEPGGDGEWTVTASELTQAYISALATASTDVYTRAAPASAAASIVAVTMTTVRAGAGSVRIAATVEASGNWRGAVVLAGLSSDYSDARVVARVSAAGLSAEWDWAEHGLVTAYIEIRPVGGARWRGTFTPDAEVIAAPTALALATAGDNRRVITWTPPEDENLAGVWLRYGTASAAWAAMTPIGALHTTARVETDQPAQGTWDLAVRAVSDGGAESDEVRVAVTTPAAPTMYDDTPLSARVTTVEGQVATATALSGRVASLERRVAALEAAD